MSSNRETTTRKGDSMEWGRKSKRTHIGRSAPFPALTFWPKVRKTSDCWLWTAACNEHGYGCFMYKSILRKAHRTAWEIEVGRIPKGKCVLHHCDTPACVKPSHLYLGTQLDNMRDILRRGRNPRSIKTHCPKGHPYTGDNVIRRKDGGRGCRTCAAQYKRKPRKRCQSLFVQS